MALAIYECLVQLDFLCFLGYGLRSSWEDLESRLVIESKVLFDYSSINKLIPWISLYISLYCFVLSTDEDDDDDEDDDYDDDDDEDWSD